MGSYSYLYVGDLEIEWMKNHPGDWGYLFTKRDKKTAIYKYADDESARRPAYVRKLGDMRKVLKLSGRASAAGKGFSFYKPNYEDVPSSVTNEICDRIKRLRVSDIKENEEYWKSKKILQRYYIDDERIQELSKKYRFDVLNQLRNESLLYLLLQNPENETVKVSWQYMDIVDGGYCSEEDIEEMVGKPDPKYLVITEGSSDTFVIKKSLELLEPILAPYFKFIDMNENYPFTGTGNLFRFCQGLVKVGIENKILIIFDNDTDGFAKYRETTKLNLPPNIKAVVLPDLKEASRFPSVGPNGEFRTNINGRAVSIEMFLDLKFQESVKPRIRWTNFDSNAEQYQGHLEKKDAYVRHFKGVKSETSKYNFRKLKHLTNWLFEQCSEIGM